MTHTITRLTAQECLDRGAKALAPYSDKRPFEAIRVYGVPRGGSCALLHLLSDPKFPFRISPVATPQLADVILDDIIDSGKTKIKHSFHLNQAGRGIPFVALVDKQAADRDLGWIQFPWEHETGPEDAVVRLIEAVGEDPNREGLLETPKRVVKAFREMTVGYGQDPKEILSKVFDEGSDEIILLRGIPFVSYCEHHLMVFSGTADVGYIPGKEGKVVGLSKLARLVDCYARRFQIQERLTKQIATAMQENLYPQGVGVIIRAAHSCMGCRGVQKTGTEMVTSCMFGMMREDPRTRSEFMSLCGRP